MKTIILHEKEAQMKNLIQITLMGFLACFIFISGCKGLKSTERKLIEIKGPNDKLMAAVNFKSENVVGNVIYSEISRGRPRGQLIAVTFDAAKDMGPLFGGAKPSAKMLFGSDAVEVLKLNKFDKDSEPIGQVAANFGFDPDPAEAQHYKNFRKDDLALATLKDIDDCEADDTECQRWRLFVVQDDKATLHRCPLAYPGPVTSFKEAANGEKLTITQGEEFKLTWAKTNEDGGELRYIRIVPVGGKGRSIKGQWPEADEGMGSAPFTKEMTKQLDEGDYTLAYETRQTSNCELVDGESKTYINFEARSIRQVSAEVAKPKKK
jgi:hypothetical protein